METMTTTAENYLGRCEDKTCDYAVFATPESIANVPTFNQVQPGGVFRVDNGPRVFSRCPEHKRTVMLRKVTGTYSDKHTCDSRCLNARGHDCTCFCGGVNHGRGYAVTAPVQAAAANPWLEDPHPYDGGSRPPKRDSTPTFVPDSDTTVVTAETVDSSTLPTYPEPGTKIRSEVRCTGVTINVGNYENTLFSFLTETGHTLKWFAPDYLANFCEAGDTMTIRAEVKRINEWNGRTEVIVRYVEKVEEA